MPEQLTQYITQLNKSNSRRASLRQALFVLSLVAILIVFWCLKLTGITMAGEAFCGKAEHVHTDECTQIGCTLEEHVHDPTCYSNVRIDIETADDWEATLAGITRGETTAQNVVAVATSQLGYTESTQNFQVDAEGIRRGITRYGQWYGNPYGDWSAMFASFCLHYAGVTDLPANAGAESMRLEWADGGLYRAAAHYAPQVGDLLFLTENGSTANAVAVITAVDNSGITVIQGDVENAVREVTYPLDDTALLGYGTVPEQSGLTVLASTPDGATIVARTTAYSSSMLTGGDSFLIYTVSSGNYYAIDGVGNAVPVYIENGNILTDVADPNTLLWTFTSSSGSYIIRNVGTGRHFHPFYNSNTDNGVNTSGAWTTSVVSSGGGVKFRASAYARLDAGNGKFVMTRNEQDASVFQFGVTKNLSVWLDGTCGGIMSLGGSPNTAYTVQAGDKVKLPSEWRSPDKYAYKLRGWYDVTNSRYYEPGAEVTVTDHMVLYADWVAESYDVGQFNAQVTDTVSTNQFVTTRMFDYGALFNVLSLRADVTVNSSGHTEKWNLLTSGNNPYNGDPTLNYIFRDWDRGNEDISYPNGHNDRNNPTSAGSVYPGLYTDKLGDLLFDPELQVIGKQYIGEGDHLFQLCVDPNDPYYGYYYYDSERNAASYNQSDGRFYVYDYLECTRDSLNSSEGRYADFLPLNSPYANTNDKLIYTYQYGGQNGEYNGVTHYQYDSKYNTDGNTTNHVGTNYWFGMSVDIRFYLPQVPGTRLDNGQYGNQDLYGGDMHFHFTGDDDVWLLIDGKLVLDLGGIHGMESGDINFATGTVTVNGRVDTALSNVLKSVQPGEHTLTLYYLERGSSLSNCAIRFNLAPRFSLSLQKEDVLTRDLLNGAQFSVYTDKACTEPATLWTSQQAYYAEEPANHVFTVANGHADMWGLIAGETYYIVETKPPDATGYIGADGIICLTIDKNGIASYSVEVRENADGDLSPGFTVHGVRIDEETQQAFIVATNAPATITEAVNVTVNKVWDDSKDHSADYITVYLTVTDPDGTVRRIREEMLSAENNWQYTWENLPKTDAEGNIVQYGVSESTVPGYVSRVEITEGPPGDDSTDGEGSGPGDVTAVGSFENGKTYLLSTKFGWLSANNNQLGLVTDQQTAAGSDNALWVATVNSDGTVTLTNKRGQTLYYDNYTFKASSSPGTYKNLRFADNRLYCYINHGGWSETLYPIGDNNVPNNLTYNHVLYTTGDSAQALVITPQALGGSPPEPEPEPPPDSDGGDKHFQITNTPAGKAVTSLTVHKIWNTGETDDPSLYEMLVVNIRLLANGQDAGLSAQLSLRNGWVYTFENLPLVDSDGNRVVYTVEEAFISEDWAVSYGNVISSGGSNPTYTVHVTNTYQTGGPVLPATGTAARLYFVLCGSGIMLGTLVYGFALRRKRKRERRLE